GHTGVVEREAAVLDPLRELRARELDEQRSCRLVDAKACELGCHAHRALDAARTRACRCAMGNGEEVRVHYAAILAPGFVRMTRLLLLSAACLVLSGCWPWGHDKKEEEDQKTSEQVLYRSAQASLRSGNYRDAIQKLQKLEARFPFGRYAEQAQLELI